jgi:hypothetical protein
VMDNLSTTDTGDLRLGAEQQRRARLHAHLRELPEPDRVPLLGDRRVRRQERRPPRLGHRGCQVNFMSVTGEVLSSPAFGYASARCTPGANTPCSWQTYDCTKAAS